LPPFESVAANMNSSSAPSCHRDTFVTICVQRLWAYQIFAVLSSKYSRSFLRLPRQVKLPVSICLVRHFSHLPSLPDFLSAFANRFSDPRAGRLCVYSRSRPLYGPTTATARCSVRYSICTSRNSRHIPPVYGASLGSPGPRAAQLRMVAEALV
jgi:hypothetical protein